MVLFFFFNFSFSNYSQKSHYFTKPIWIVIELLNGLPQLWDSPRPKAHDPRKRWRRQHRKKEKKYRGAMKRSSFSLYYHQFHYPDLKVETHHRNQWRLSRGWSRFWTQRRIGLRLSTWKPYQLVSADTVSSELRVFCFFWVRIVAMMIW